MNETLLKAGVLLLPTALVFAYFLVLTRRKIPWSLLQLSGVFCLLIVVLTHVCEALSLFPWMHWGAQHSAGHYLDLSSDLLGVILLPAGYVLRLMTHSARNCRN
jgi:hypothetical protein